jgi:GNAT superfamily N-acetyltransferase
MQSISQLSIRHANETDLALIFSFIQKKAEFDKQIGSFTGVLKATEVKLQRTLFNDTPFAKVLLAERAGEAVGFALYYFRYSSFAAQPSIWLDDLYVKFSRRGQSVGTTLLIHLTQIAQTHHCTHIAWTADIRNIRAVEFYQRIGAEVIDQKGNILLFQSIATRGIFVHLHCS